MAGIRAVLIGVSPMLRDIVKHSIGGARHMEIVGEFCAEEWSERLRLFEPEVIIISLGRGESDDVAGRLLKTAPKAKIVVLSSDNRQAVCCVMRPHRKVLRDFSPQEIGEFISGPN